LANILIIDDDIMLCNALSAVILSMGHIIDTAHTLREGLEKLNGGEFALVILDVWLPDGNGLEVLPKIRQMPSTPEVIILTGVGDADGAELAIRSGAMNYITKPPTLNKIKLPVQRAVEYYEARNRKLMAIALNKNGIIGESAAVRFCLEKVAQASATEASVLITGETGTGKELFAHAIHKNSHRRDKPFVVVDCAALPENLVESVLFGHVKGAFTGADRNTEGLIRQANGGVLFLDEVGELPISIQKAFLRVLQEKTFRPVGGNKEHRSEFRLVAATHRNLEVLVKEWKFREDLMFRLCTISIEIPPLRERREDIEMLTCYFIEKFSREMGVEHKGFSRDFLDALKSYEWPGNVRELISAVESSMAAAGEESLLTTRHLPMNLRVKLVRQTLSNEKRIADEHDKKPMTDNFPALKEFRQSALDELEKQYLEELMSFTKGEVRAACMLSGLSKARLYALLKYHRVPTKRGLSKPMAGTVSE
jgi:two-component system, NtrC family, response regulator